VYIYTDGSLHGLGACCLQINNQNHTSHGAGPAYQITEEKTGKDLRGLVTYDKSKHFLSSAVKDHAALSVVKPCFKRAIKILDDRIVNQVREFLVLFKDKTQKWRTKSQIGEELLNDFQQNKQQIRLWKNRQ